MFEFFAVAIAVVALIVARKAMNQAATLQARLDALEASGWRAQPTPPPLVPAHEAEPATALETETFTVPIEATAPLHQAPPSAPEDAADQAPTTPPPLPPAAPGFEERVGTRWVVWLGGLTLALGGFFMVRYSIDAGLLGPGVRTLLGGAFALALLAAGEWTRRKESTSAIEVLSIANIPAILTAAGTAVAFGTVYAAYALYGFLAPASAFILLGLVALGTLAAALLHGPMLAGLGIVAAFGTPLLVSSEKPDFWALYIYLAVVTAAAFGLARIRLWSWLAVRHGCARAALDLAGSQIRPAAGRPLWVPRDFRICAYHASCGVRLAVWAARGRRPRRAGLVGIAGGLSVRRRADRAGELPCGSSDRRVHHSDRGYSARGLARTGRDRRDRARGSLRRPRVFRVGRACQSGHAGVAGRTAAGHRRLPQPTARFRCIWSRPHCLQSDLAAPDFSRKAAARMRWFR